MVPIETKPSISFFFLPKHLYNQSSNADRCSSYSWKDSLTPLYDVPNSLFPYEVSKGQKIHKKFSAQRDSITAFK